MYTIRFIMVDLCPTFSYYFTSALSSQFPMQLCCLLDAILIEHPRLADPQIVESLFIFCVLWSIGATLVQQHETPVRYVSISLIMKID